jgi:UDP-N-acetylmuramyl pentapeptide synthase
LQAVVEVAVMEILGKQSVAQEGAVMAPPQVVVLLKVQQEHLIQVEVEGVVRARLMSLTQVVQELLLFLYPKHTLLHLAVVLHIQEQS